MDRSYSVVELTEAIQLALGSWLPNEVWVEGQVANLSRTAPGHVFFQLVEPGDGETASAACLSVTLLDSARQHVNAVLRRSGGAMRMVDGTRIRIRARVELFPPQGRLQLRMSGIDPAYTLGLLQSERERVLKALAADGLLDANKALPFPIVPLRIGLLTSAGSAAMADFVTELERSAYGFEIVHIDTRVQGIDADRSVAAGLEELARREVDVVALVRGGGARTDLATFDSELLARTIARAAVPVVTGIGHEIDRSVADEVAHTSFKTPTACAAGLVAQVGAFDERLRDSWRRLRTSTTRHHHRAEASLDRRGSLIA